MRCALLTFIASFAVGCDSQTPSPLAQSDAGAAEDAPAGGSQPAPTPEKAEPAGALVGEYHTFTVYNPLSKTHLGLFLTLRADGTFEAVNRSDCGFSYSVVKGTWEPKNQSVTFTPVNEFGFLKGHFTKADVERRQGHVIIVLEGDRETVGKNGIGPESRYACFHKSDADHLFKTKADEEGN